MKDVVVWVGDPKLPEVAHMLFFGSPFRFGNLLSSRLSSALVACAESSESKTGRQ
jgi:hypothetical protein